MAPAVRVPFLRFFGILSISCGVFSSDEVSLGLRRFPRVELHVHLDGSIDIEELYSVCKQRGIELPGGVGRPKSSRDVQRYMDTITPAWHKFDVVNNIVGG